MFHHCSKLDGSISLSCYPWPNVRLHLDAARLRVQAEKLSPGAEREQFVGMARRVEIANEWPHHRPSRLRHEPEAVTGTTIARRLGVARGDI
jgi:hypothetical protein